MEERLDRRYWKRVAKDPSKADEEPYWYEEEEKGKAGKAGKEG